MLNIANRALWIGLLFAAIVPLCQTAHRAVAAEDEAERRTMKLGKLTMVAPKDWVQKKAVFVTYDFSAPAAKEDTVDGRMTVMSAGGSVDENISRWYSQFTQEDGGSTKKRAKTEKTKVAGYPAHVVDLSGTYTDLRKPGVEFKDYRMLAAIIETKEGNLFIKFVGPKRTVARHEKAFRQMLEDAKGE
jgi:hypothetical protein